MKTLVGDTVGAFDAATNTWKVTSLFFTHSVRSGETILLRSAMTFQPSFDELVPLDMQTAVDTQVALYQLSISALSIVPKTPAGHKRKASDFGNINRDIRTPTR
ncbi:hypothetical protein PM082_024373 [Marasmius tenuissimus]|nr:hypothetical protein PM082_024373 [Marasmius tenuissimus]